MAAVPAAAISAAHQHTDDKQGSLSRPAHGKQPTLLSLMKRPEVLKATGLSVSGLYAAMAAGRIKRPVPTGLYGVAWIEDDIIEYQQSLLRARAEREAAAAARIAKSRGAQ